MNTANEQILPGQRYQSTNASHPGWVVDVKRVTDLQVELETQAPTKGTIRTMSHDAFLSNYSLVKNPIHTIVPKQSEPDPKPCAVCQQLKPLTEYRNNVIKRGANRGKVVGHNHMCKVCQQERVDAGLKKKKVQTNQTAPQVILPPIVSNITQKQLTQPTTLSNQLLALATQVEALEHNTAQVNLFSTLLSAARDIVVEAELTYGVIILKQETFRQLEQAVISLKDINL